MSTNTVYAPTPKGVRNAKFHPDDRIVFLGDGSVVVYRGDQLIQSDVLYRRPDSHLQLTEERLPTELKATDREKIHVKDNKIQLPFKLV